MTQRWKCREDFKVHSFSFLVVLHIALHREVMAGNPRNPAVLLEHKLLLRVAAMVRKKGSSGGPESLRRVTSGSGLPTST